MTLGQVLVDTMTLGQVFLRILCFPPVSIISPIFHTRIYSRAAPTRRTNGLSLWNLKKKQCSYRNRKSPDNKMSLFPVFRGRCHTASIAGAKLSLTSSIAYGNLLLVNIQEHDVAVRRHTYLVCARNLVPVISRCTFYKYRHCSGMYVF
jgi:hypothetical protein